MNRWGKTWMALAAGAVAAGASAQQAATDAALGERIRAKYPATQFRQIKPTAVPGIYEVVMGQNVAYVDESGRYFFFGRMFDMETQRDLTEPRMQEINTVNVSSLPLHNAIKSVRGTGARTLVVFSDPECPYCRKLEQTLEQMRDVTIYTFLYPLAQIHPEARRKAIGVWCAPDREQAWRELMLKGAAPVASTECAHPIDENVLLGQRLGINGTPTMISGDGRRMAGAVPVDAISAFLDRGANRVAGGGR